MSEIKPVEYKVLIRLDVLKEKTAGGIIIPDNRLDRDQMAQTEATLEAVGGSAFEDWNEKGPIPKVGDRILVTKYAGEAPGKDEDGLRLCMDKDICAILG